MKMHRIDQMARRDGRVAEGARLESVYTFTGIGGSNPSLSASNLGIDPPQRASVLASIRSSFRRISAISRTLPECATIPVFSSHLKTTTTVKPPQRTDTPRCIPRRQSRSTHMYEPRNRHRSERPQHAKLPAEIQEKYCSRLGRFEALRRAPPGQKPERLPRRIATGCSGLRPLHPGSNTGSDMLARTRDCASRLRVEEFRRDREPPPILGRPPIARFWAASKFSVALRIELTRGWVTIT